MANLLKSSLWILFVLLSFPGSGFTQPEKKGITVIYLFDYETTIEDAKSKTTSVHEALLSHLSAENSLNQEIFIYSSLPSKTKTTITTTITCKIQDEKIATYTKGISVSGDFNSFISVFGTTIAKSLESCQPGTLTSKSWLIIRISRDTFGKNLRAALCTNTCDKATCSPSTCSGVIEGNICNFSTKLRNTCNFADLFSIDNNSSVLQSITIDGLPNARIGTIDNRDARCICNSSGKSCQANLEPGKYRIFAGYLQKAKLAPNVVVPFDAKENGNGVDFKIPSPVQAPTPIFIAPITTFSRRVAGIPLLILGVGVTAAALGVGLGDHRIYEPCLIPPSSLPTYDCVGTSGSYGSSLGMSIAGGALGAGLSLAGILLLALP